MLLNAGELLFDPCEATIIELRQNFKRWQLIGSRVFETFWLSCIADAYLRIGRSDEGLTFIEKARKVARKKREQFYIPEIHRLQSELMIAKSKKNRSTAKKELWMALERAQKSGAQIFELRILVSLYNFLGHHGGTASEKEKVKEALTNCYGSFYEGFETEDLLQRLSLRITETQCNSLFEIRRNYSPHSIRPPTYNGRAVFFSHWKSMF